MRRVVEQEANDIGVLALALAVDNGWHLASLSDDAPFVLGVDVQVIAVVL